MAVLNKTISISAIAQPKLVVFLKTASKSNTALDHVIHAFEAFSSSTPQWWYQAKTDTLPSPDQSHIIMEINILSPNFEVYTEYIWMGMMCGENQNLGRSNMF